MCCFKTGLDSSSNPVRAQIGNSSFERYQTDCASYPNPVEIMDPNQQNRSCDPFTPSSTACSLGNYVQYTINASSPADIAAGLQFAQKNNIRIVIKNTGHE